MSRALLALVVLTCSLLGPGCGQETPSRSQPVTGEAQGSTPEGGAAAGVAGAAAAAPLCEDFEPCGGDPTGRWVIEGWCLESPAEVPSCPSAKPTVKITMAGRATLGEDGAYSGQFEQSMGFTYGLPAACVPEGTATCEVLGTDPMRCRGESPANCVCESPEFSETQEEQGTWTVDGNTLTTELTSPERMTTRNPICVDGDTIRLQVTGGPVEPVMILRRQK